MRVTASSHVLGGRNSKLAFPTNRSTAFSASPVHGYAACSAVAHQEHVAPAAGRATRRVSTRSMVSATPVSRIPGGGRSRRSL